MNRYRWRTFVLELVMVAAAAMIGFPVYVLVNLAVRAPSDTSSPIRPTASPTLANFTDAWQQAGLGGALINSALVTTCSVLIVLAVSALAAYPLARATARWSRWMFLLIMLGLILPFQLAALPLYQTMRDLGLLGTVWALILFYSGLQVPFTTFLYVGSCAALPRGLRGRRAHRRLRPAAGLPARGASRCSSRSPYRAGAQRGRGMERLLHPAAVPVAAPTSRPVPVAIAGFVGSTSRSGTSSSPRW
jgi:hypothetical protein